MPTPGKSQDPPTFESALGELEKIVASMEAGQMPLELGANLDRLTAGVLLFTARREVRGAYQTLFARGEVGKTYLARAGVEVIEARISHLAYAQEIAGAMLQRQQAGAIIAARERIVQGAVGMVEMALDMLSHKGIVQLDEERKAAMVSNLLVVLCGEKGAQPILNTGTIHQ